MGATAGAGIGLGVLGKMLANQDVWKAERDTWFEAFKKFMLYSQGFEKNLTELKDKLFSPEERPKLDKEFPTPVPPDLETKILKTKIFAWEYNNFKGASEDAYREIYREIANNINFEVNTATTIKQSEQLIKEGETVVLFLQDTEVFINYLKRLTTPPPDGSFDAPTRQRILELQSIVKQTATSLVKQFHILRKNQAWIGAK